MNLFCRQAQRPGPAHRCQQAFDPESGSCAASICGEPDGELDALFGLGVSQRDRVVGQADGAFAAALMRDKPGIIFIDREKYYAAAAAFGHGGDVCLASIQHGGPMVGDGLDDSPLGADQ